MANDALYYVSLGDSMSIDAYAGGPGRGAASLLFRNRADDFGEWAGRDLESVLPGVRMVPLSRDGATSAAVRFVQIGQLKEMAIRPAVVTLTMGGNDLLTVWGNDRAADAAQKALQENAEAVFIELRPLLLPSAPVVLGTIYDPSDATGDTSGLAVPPWPRGLEWLAAFNRTLTEAAEKHGVLLADVHSRFLGHGRTAGDVTEYDARPQNRAVWYCGTIEPNAWGASEIRAAWWNALQSAFQTTAPPR